MDILNNNINKEDLECKLNSFLNNNTLKLNMDKKDKIK